MELRDELDSLLRQPLKYTSAMDVSRSYPLLFGDPDQLASRRSKRERGEEEEDEIIWLIDSFVLSFV